MDFDTDLASHNFDAEDGATILLEGNVFNDCKAPLSAETLGHSKGIFNVPSASDASACAAALGRDCEINSLTDSGDFGSFTDTAAVDAVGKFASVWEAVAAADVSSANAGVGKLDASAAPAKVDADIEVAAAEIEPEVEAPKVEAEASTETSSGEASTETEASKADEPVASAEAAAPAPAPSTPASGETAAKYGRCGGIGHDGAISCAEGSCTVINDCK